MEYSEWKDIFSTLFLNVDFPDEWTGVRFKSEWNKGNSGGLPNKMTPQILRRYAKNPQFYVRPRQDCKMMFAMSQREGRLRHGQDFYKYPFKEVLNFANVAVFRLDGDETVLTQFDKKKAEYISPVKRERENAGRLHLKKDQGYVIIPSCETPGTTGDLFLSIYVNCALRDVQIKRVFHPDDPTQGEAVLPYLIPEEAEKISSRCPPWKLDLVRECLPFIVTDEDHE